MEAVNKKDIQGRNSSPIPASEIADFLLDVGVLLVSSGAHSGRVWRNCNRMANHWGFRLNINPMLTGMMVSVWDIENSENTVTSYKTAPSHTVHFEKLTLISHLSWAVSRNKLTFEEAKLELERIKRQPHYDYKVVAVAVGVSCACLCVLAGGNGIDALFAFLAASAGSLLRSRVLKFGFNPFLSFIFASFVTTLIAAQNTVFQLGRAPEQTLAVAVLYLIPGVPLINTVIDLLEGFLPASLSRALFAASIVCCIAVGMTLCIISLGINKF